MTRTLVLALLATSAGCTFSYKNPAEDLRPGEVGGRAVVASVPRGGISVSVKGSALAQGTRATGRFMLLPLPVGTHTLLLRNGAGGLVARDVDLRYGRDGQPESVWVGDVSVPAATASATITGTASYLPDGIDVGYVYDALTGATTAFARESFSLAGFSVGEHTLYFSARTWGGAWLVGGPRTVKIVDSDSGCEKPLGAVPLHVPSASPDQAGRLKVRLAAIGGVDVAQFDVTGLPSTVTCDSTGLCDGSAPEGTYVIGVGGTGVATLPPPVDVPVVAGAVTDLGTLYVTGGDAETLTSLACASDADCAPGVCVERVCQGAFTPPPAASASLPLCDPALDLACTQFGGGTCGIGYQTTLGTCVETAPASGSWVCAPMGGCCTPDGTTTYCGPVG